MTFLDSQCLPYRFVERGFREVVFLLYILQNEWTLPLTLFLSLLRSRFLSYFCRPWQLFSPFFLSFTNRKKKMRTDEKMKEMNVKKKEK